MDSIISQAKPYLDYIAVGLIWIVIGIYVLLERRKKNAPEEDYSVDLETSRQSKGRLSSLDAMAGIDTHAEPQVVNHVSPVPQPAANPSAPLPFQTISDDGIGGASPLSYDDPLQMPISAEEVYKSAPEEETDRSALLTQYTSGDGGGVEEMERMLAQDPDNLQLLDWLAFMYYSNDQIDKAIESYVRIIHLEPGNASQHYYLGNCYCKKGILDKAREQWEEVQRLKPGSKYAQKAGKRIRQL